MDNRNDNIEYQNFLIELIQLINRDSSNNREPRQQRNYSIPRRNNIFNNFNTHQYQTNNRYQSAESLYRQQIVDIVSQYNANIHEHQLMMRDYNDVLLYSLEMLQLMRPNRNTNTTFRQTQPHQVPRNYLSTTGFGGLFNHSRNIPFTNIFSEPVIVRPTNNQISNATRTFNYSTELSNNSRCPITLEDFQQNDVVCEIKHCRHVFKQQSIMDWFQRNVRCPVCRYDIREYVEREGNPYEEREEAEDDADYDRQEQRQQEEQEQQQEEEDNSLSDSGPFYVDLSNNISRTSSPLRRQGSPNLNTILVTNQINTIATNISNILHNYIDQEASLQNDTSSNIFTFEIPIIYFDVSNSRT